MKENTKILLVTLSALFIFSICGWAAVTLKEEILALPEPGWSQLIREYSIESCTYREYRIRIEGHPQWIRKTVCECTDPNVRCEK